MVLSEIGLGGKNPSLMRSIPTGMSYSCRTGAPPGMAGVPREARVLQVHHFAVGADLIRDVGKKTGAEAPVWY